jgi:hypothetical protein
MGVRLLALLVPCLGLLGACFGGSEIKGWEAQIGATNPVRAAQDLAACQSELEFAAALASQVPAARTADQVRDAAIRRGPSDRQIINCMRRRGWYPIM